MNRALINQGDTKLPGKKPKQEIVFIWRIKTIKNRFQLIIHKFSFSCTCTHTRGAYTFFAWGPRQACRWLFFCLSLCGNFSVFFLQFFFVFSFNHPIQFVWLEMYSVVTCFILLICSKIRCSRIHIPCWCLLRQRSCSLYLFVRYLYHFLRFDFQYRQTYENVRSVGWIK